MLVGVYRRAWIIFRPFRGPQNVCRILESFSHADPGSRLRTQQVEEPFARQLVIVSLTLTLKGIRPKESGSSHINRLPFSFSTLAIPIG